MSERVKLKGNVNYPRLVNHSLIKVIVLHRLIEKKMTWDMFIEEALKMHITTSPSQHQSMSVHPMKVGSSRKHDEVFKACRHQVTKTYQRGRRLVFSPKIEEGAKPTTLAKQGSPSHHEAYLHDEEPIEHDFDLVELEAHDDHKTLQKLIKCKYYQIMDLKDYFERAKFRISFLEKENRQLKAKQLVMDNEKLKGKKEEMKGKEVVDDEDTQKHEGNVRSKTPRTMALRKTLQREREQKPPVEELTFEDRISMEINEDRYFVRKLYIIEEWNT